VVIVSRNKFKNAFGQTSIRSKTASCTTDEPRKSYRLGQHSQSLQWWSNFYEE